jgi:hypothetical protein
VSNSKRQVLLERRSQATASKVPREKKPTFDGPAFDASGPTGRWMGAAATAVPLPMSSPQ